MARARKRWLQHIGPKGAKVTIAERTVGGSVYLYTYDHQLNGNRKKSLGFRVRDANGCLIPEAVAKARKEALRLSNRLIEGERPSSELALREEVTLYKQEVLPRQSLRHQEETRREVELWLAFLGPAFGQVPSCV
jgi:hypothetical protein